MSYTFDEIMAYHPDNNDVYREIRNLLPRIIPFIGAGLTQFAYGTWSDALKTLSGKLTDGMAAQKVADLISSKNYLDAAQLLEDLRTPANLARDLAGAFSGDKLERNRGQLPKEPISLLPYLFPDLVLTTNFDESLETVYRESGHPLHVFCPGHPGLLKQLLRKGDVSSLFKLHGTVTDTLIEYEKIVFTRTQYDRHYGNDSPLTDELATCFENRMMLFLGCSLDSDRTMELLQAVINPGDSYYTIIDCEPSERDEKIRQLGAKHIHAILYEKGRHEAVRVILEHLLEETDPDAYQNLPFCVGALKSLDTSERFSYKADIIPFVGREEELHALNDFLSDDHIAFRWWAIIGPGGIGKSRLAYEFQKWSRRDWAVHYLDSDDYTDLSLLTGKLTRKTLLIADYVQENAKVIGKWMEQINEKKHSLPIRLLLVERDSTPSETNSGWVKQLYEDVHHVQKLKNACYKEDFLTLHPMQDDDLLDIIGNYAIALKQRGKCVVRVFSDKAKRMLLEKLKSIDPVLFRPLYALFLTDAYVAGQHPEHWDRKEILDYITTREQSRLSFNIRHIFGKSDEKLYDACLHLYCMATVLQDAPLKELQTLCADAWDTIQKKADAFISPADMLERTGFVSNGTVFAMRPDLIGEYFVYSWLLQHRSEAQQFLDTVWQRPISTATFFNRMFHDYNDLLNENAQNWELILPDCIPTSYDKIFLYTGLLANATFYCEIVEEVERQVRLLEHVASSYPESLKIVIRHANSLVNLSMKQDELNAQDTIEDLQRIADEHPNVPDISSALATGLCNLSIKQDKPGAYNTIERLQHLVDEHPDVPNIAALLAKSLVNLVINNADAESVVTRLQHLADKYPDILDIKIKLAKGLSNLTRMQEKLDALNTINRLAHLADKCPDVLDITVIFAKDLVDLSYKQNEIDMQDTIDRLQHLSDEHPDVPVITVALAQGLLNLSVQQNEKDMQDTIDRLQHLVDEHPDVPDIAVLFAQGLSNLVYKQSVCKQNEQNTRDAIVRLQCLEDEYPDVPDIAVALAQGLLNLMCSWQNEKDMQDTINRLQHLVDKHPDIPDLVVSLALGLLNLLNLSSEQNEQNTWDTITRLQRLADKHPDIPDLVVSLALGLLNLLNLSSEQNTWDTITRLQRLADEHPDIPDLAVMLALGLLALSTKQNEPAAHDTIKHLIYLAEKYPNIQNIAMMLSQGLFALSNMQDETNEYTIIERLQLPSNENSDTIHISTMLLYGVFSFICKQDKSATLDTIKRLKILWADHPKKRIFSCEQNK